VRAASAVRRASPLLDAALHFISPGLFCLLRLKVI
jgi:hypothetical protein